MSAITMTRVSVPGFGTKEIPNFDLTEAQVRDVMKSEIDLSQYTATNTVEGTVRVISFQRRTGNKGC